MKVEEFCQMLGVSLVINYHPDQSGPWIASFASSFSTVFFKNSEEDCMARGCSGWGDTPNTAIKDLLMNLKEHKYIVVASRENEKNRTKTKLPTVLEY